MCASAHGDDFVTFGRDRDLKYVQESLCAKYVAGGFEVSQASPVRHESNGNL